MKKKTIAILLSGICLAAAVSGFGVTYAYLIDNDSASNVLTVGETVTIVNEDFVPPEELRPGVEFNKDPYVTNTGNLDCYVRMRIDFSSSTAQEMTVLEDMDNVNWVYNPDDGYYYCKNVISPGENTSSLFKKVKVKEYRTDEHGHNIVTSPYTMDDMENFDIFVYSESIQKGDYESWQAAWGVTI